MARGLQPGRALGEERPGRATLSQPKRVLALVEGQTEERFIKDVLGAELLSKGISVTPKIVVTSRRPFGKQFKGGVQSYDQVKRDLRRLLGDTDVVAITTMLDLYALPTDFPSFSDPGRTFATLEDAFHADIGDSRFIPYLSVHEFEALIFVEPDEIDKALPGANAAAALRAVRSQYASPEDIDQGSSTHPSARLAKLVPGYQKPVHGSLITGRVGLARLREACPHFGSWVSKLESL